jgi:hypothetical protein
MSNIKNYYSKAVFKSGDRETPFEEEINGRAFEFLSTNRKAMKNALMRWKMRIS